MNDRNVKLLGNYAKTPYKFSERSGQQLGVVKALNCLGIIARYEKKLKEADTHFTEALEIAKVLGDKWHTAFCR